ncbi:hypothetical protein VE00_08471 [Pseudogymnoascus sp. WSF 3629]|nr:hypothetical protein VE00_08471 [Pseudogymnoascus sp. WSF 3629]
MVFSPWARASLVAYGLLMAADVVSGNPRRHAASPTYRNSNVCPERCSDLGTDPTKWHAYHNLEQFSSCDQAVIQAFSIYDDVDDASKGHGIYACTSYGPDFANLPQSRVKAVTAETVDATYEVGWWDDGHNLAAADIRSASKQLRKYMKGGHGSSETAEILYARSGRAAVGLYLGKGLQKAGVSAVALKYLEDNLSTLNTTSRNVAIQFCSPDHTSEHTFGFFATSSRTFAPVQKAMQSWANGTCVSFPNSQTFEGKAILTTNLETTSASNNTVAGTNSTSAITSRTNRVKLNARAECSTTQVQGGDDCGKLAVRCGITAADFTKYNSDASLCSSLKPGQHVCCSAGTLPDFAPKPNADGSCNVYYVAKDDNCSNIAAANSLTNDDLEDFNKNTWAWSGCDHLQFNMNICLSTGDPPMPPSQEGIVCGPQKPGTKQPTDGTKLADLNPCALNACCDIWGQCGITAEFCTDTGTGNPGTAEPGTNGCISNCGTKMVKGAAPTEFRKIAYYEGYSFGRECLFQDVLQIDSTQYTHLHFAFGTLTPDHQVEVGDIMSSYQFENFRRIQGPKRILSFGGWDFSTMPETYTIFREGVTAANRLKMATNIANFIKEKDLDGVDIDWEYPGAPDIPGIPAASLDDGDNYLAFLVILKNLLPGKSVSIAAPSSYWYLKAYPLKKIAAVIDYIVYMTYDLHGQWDAQNPNSQEGCANGNCLRSQVNLTETMSSLVMITKAEVPSNKVVVGITSYGRSFNMAQAGCHTPECLYTGDRLNSDAAKGKCTATAGYISDAEIKEIMEEGSRVANHYVDPTSNSNILVYDDTQWVAYMDDDIRTQRHALYTGLNLGGTTNWATDLEKYNDVPGDSGSWLNYKLSIKAGKNPWQVGDRTGNWTEIMCDSQAASDIRGLTPEQRWDGMDMEDAWKDSIAVWKDYDRGKTQFTFTQSMSLTLNGPERASCGSLKSDSNCIQTLQCSPFQNKGSGAAAYELWNSFVIIHEMYQTFNDALYKAAATVITPALSDFEKKFTPVPPEEDNTWLLLLLDLVTVGISAVAAPFFNNFIAKLPYFIAKGAAADNIKDLTILAIGQSTTIAKDLLSTKESDWTEDKQDEFSNYLGQSIAAWGNTTGAALQRLFNGEDESIDALYAIISDGKLISGGGAETSTAPPETSEAELENHIARAFFAYAIPTGWTFSKHYAFVIDSGYDCSSSDPLGDYLDADTMHATYGCYQNKLYYLAAAQGDSKTCHDNCNDGHCDKVCVDSKFKAPPGLDTLDGKNFGGVSVQDLIQGSVRSYLQNNNENGGGFVDITNGGSFDDLMAIDLTTPGFIRLPVCTPDRAYKSWDTAGPSDDDPLYPCSIAKGPDHCQISSFVDQTSDASPPVDDCRHIITNIEGDGGATWTTGISGQRELVSYGECKFGVESKSGADGDVTFKVGSQDIIDIITEAIKQFGGGGKIGAKGVVDCDGNVHDTTIEWGIY